MEQLVERMLTALKPLLDEIETENDWEFNFVQNILIRYEENPDWFMTGGTLRKLAEIHKKWVTDRPRRESGNILSFPGKK